MREYFMSHIYRRPWGTVAGSFLVMAIGSGPIVFVAFSVFMPAIIAEFGWSRTTLSSAIFTYNVMGALGMPILGALIDRYGLHNTTLAGVIIFACLLAGASFMPASVMLLVLIYGGLGFFGTTTTPLPYAKAVSAVFDRQRGFALGIAMAGYGVGAALIPVLSAYFIESVGWRSTYLILAAIVFVVAVVAISVLIAEPGNRSNAKLSADAPLQGLTMRQTLTHSMNFWYIAAALFLVAVAINGVVTHFVFMATDKGLTKIEASSLLGVLGASSIVGRLVAGFLIDRFFAPRVAGLIFILPAIGIVLLALNLPNSMLVITAITLGIGLGAEVDVMGYVVGRYFGMRSFGEIYGYLLAVFTIGSGVGSYAMGVAYDGFNSYTNILWFMAAGIVCSIILINCLSAYRYPAQLNH
jgi:MFS family permease